MTSTSGTKQAAGSKATSAERWVPRLLLGSYLVVLGWLTLFKLSFDIPAILAARQYGGLNLIPFAGVGRAGLSETVSNVVTFFPFGVLLAMNLKRSSWWRLVVVVFVLSLTIEGLQVLLAIGTGDVTDVITNTCGGVMGALGYRLAAKAVRTETLDRTVATLGVALVVTFALLRLFVFKVRY